MRKGPVSARPQPEITTTERKWISVSKTVTPKLSNPTVPLDPWGNCLWCGMEPGPDCCQGNHPDRWAAERDYREAPVLLLGFPAGTPQPAFAIDRADYVRRPRTNNTIGGAR